MTIVLFWGRIISIKRLPLDLYLVLYFKSSSIRDQRKAFLVTLFTVYTILRLLIVNFIAYCNVIIHENKGIMRHLKVCFSLQSLVYFFILIWFFCFFFMWQGIFIVLSIVSLWFCNTLQTIGSNMKFKGNLFSEQ